MAFSALLRQSLLWLACGAIAVGCNRNDGPLDFHGVRLGMAPRDVREKFDLGASGTFDTEAGKGVKLHWTSTARTSVNEAEFEFHNGMLTYIHADVSNVDPAAVGPALWIGPTSVVERKPTRGTMRVLSIARDCPEHADKVKELITPPK